MPINYATLTPLLQVMTNVTAQLEQGASSRAVMASVRDQFQLWQPIGAVWKLSLPLQNMAGVHVVSQDIVDDIVLPQAGSEGEEEEVRPDHIVHVLRITGDRIRAAVSADDVDSVDAIDHLAIRWTALWLTLSTQFPVAKLFQSEPPTRRDSQPVMSMSTRSMGTMLSLLKSSLDEIDDQAGAFVFDPRQADPALAVRLIMVNKVILRESGFAEGYLTGPNGFFSEMHQEDLPKILLALQQAMTTGTAFIKDMRMKALRKTSVDKKVPLQNIWRSADIKIILEQASLGGRRIGIFRFTAVRDLGEVLEKL